MPKSLSLRHRRFVDALLGSAAGNAKQAAISAGYKPGHSAETQGSRLLRNAEVAKAIRARQQRSTAKDIGTAEQRDAHLWALAMNATVPPATQVSAIKELNKCSGRHSIKHVLDVTEKLSDIIAASRGPA